MCICSVCIGKVYIYLEHISSADLQPEPMQPILTHDGSNYAVWSKKMAFGGHNDDNLSFGDRQPQKPPTFGVSVEITAKTRLINNF